MKNIHDVMRQKEHEIERLKKEIEALRTVVPMLEDTGTTRNICVKVETPTGQSTTVPLAFLTPKQMENFLQSEFKRLAEKAGVKGARIHVERAMIADYQEVIRNVTACLHSARAKAA